MIYILDNLINLRIIYVIVVVICLHVKVITIVIN